MIGLFVDLNLGPCEISAVWDTLFIIYRTPLFNIQAFCSGNLIPSNLILGMKIHILFGYVVSVHALANSTTAL